MKHALVRGTCDMIYVPRFMKIVYEDSSNIIVCLQGF
jgi:hypothetical protein